MENAIIRDLGGYVARHRFARITARKARFVADAIRGMGANEALEQLELMPQRGAAFYKKVLLSAIANASQDEDVNVNNLVIVDARADEGPLVNNRMRFRPGPQGRAMPYAKKTSHLQIIVADPAQMEEQAFGDDSNEAGEA